MRPIVLQFVFIILSYGGEEDEGGKEERLQSYQRDFARRKRKIADAIIALVEDVIQAEDDSFRELPESVVSQNISSSKFRDVSRRIKEEVSNEVLLEKGLSKPKIIFSPGMRTSFGRKNQNLVKTKQVEVFEPGKIKEGRRIKEDTLKEEDKIVAHEPVSIPMEEEQNKYIVIETLADDNLSRKKRRFSSPGSGTIFEWKRQDITTVKDQTLGQEHDHVKAENSGQFKETTDKKSKVKVDGHFKEHSRTEVIEVRADKDLSRKKRTFSPGRRTYFGRNRRDIFSESKGNVLESNGQIEKNLRQESRNIPHTGKRLEITSLKADFADNLYPYTFSPFRGIFLFPFNTGFADFGNHLMVSPTTPRPSSITTLAPQKARPVHILECSGTSSSSCNNGLCTVECSEGNKVEVNCDKGSMVVKTKVVEGKISVSVYCGQT